ncbi:MAG: phosphohistidine phosphatase [Halieaceae bacterium]|jgi:phosphohistidine phosphatase
MKTLRLLRHAKSSWQSPELDDHDRGLNERGKRDAPRMGKALAEFLLPPVVHCSGALRARRTLEGLCAGWPELSAQQHSVDEALYTFDYANIVDWLQAFPDTFDACFLLGHNPALTDLCNFLVGRQALDNLPTAGYLELTLAVDEWNDLRTSVATLERGLFPRDLS